MKDADPNRTGNRDRTIDIAPGLWLTLVLSYPYLSDRLTSYPRSSSHDIAYGLIIAFVWGSTFFWDGMGQALPLLQTLIRLVIALAAWGAVATLYGTIVYLLFTT